MPALKQKWNELLFCDESKGLLKWQNASSSWPCNETAPSLDSEPYIDLLEQFNVKNAYWRKNTLKKSQGARENVQSTI